MLPNLLPLCHPDREPLHGLLRELCRRGGRRPDVQGRRLQQRQGGRRALQPSDLFLRLPRPFLARTLQYLPHRIAEILATLAVKPKRIVLNATAVHPERTL